MNPPTDQMPPPAAAAPDELEACSVLVAEDEIPMANLLALNLRRLGHRIAGIAHNGKDAVAMAIETRPDVILMDIHMPVLDGIQAAREILAAWSVPIILISGMSDPATVRRAADLRTISYLVKPFSPVQLKVAMQVAIAQGRGTAGPAGAAPAA